MTLVLLAALFLAGVGTAFANPRLAVWLWILVCGFVPFWVGVSSPFYLSALSLVGIAILAGSLWRGQISLIDRDLWIVLIGLFIVVCGLLGIARPGDVTSVVSQWIVSYFVARILVEAVGAMEVYRAIAITFTLVAIGTIAEFTLHANPYFGWVVDNVQYRAWGYGQVRGNIVRAEWAFGHSIALGCALGMAIPIVSALRWPAWVKFVQILVIGVAAVFTFSRAGFITALMGVAMVLLFSRDAGGLRVRALAVAAAGVVAYFVTPLITSVFAADDGRAEVSADYRKLLNSLIATMRPFGLATGYSESSRGNYSFGSFRSIDSTFVFLGVSFGWVVALLALAGALFLVIRTVMLRCSPAELAVVAVIPALFTVAPITQFGTLLFFYIGMTVSIAVHERRRVRDESRPAPDGASNPPRRPRVRTYR